jgi:hypothetical protein
VSGEGSPPPVRGYEIEPDDTVIVLVDEGPVEVLVTGVETLPSALGDARSVTWASPDGRAGVADYLAGDLVFRVARGREAGS